MVTKDHERNRRHATIRDRFARSCPGMPGFAQGLFTCLEGSKSILNRRLRRFQLVFTNFYFYRLFTDRKSLGQSDFSILFFKLNVSRTIWPFETSCRMATTDRERNAMDAMTCLGHTGLPRHARFRPNSVTGYGLSGRRSEVACEGTILSFLWFPRVSCVSRAHSSVRSVCQSVGHSVARSLAR